MATNLRPVKHIFTAFCILACFYAFNASAQQKPRNADSKKDTLKQKEKPAPAVQEDIMIRKTKPGKNEAEIVIRKLQRHPAGKDPLIRKFYFDDGADSGLRFFRFDGDSIVLNHDLDTMINNMHFKFDTDSSGGQGFITMNKEFNMVAPDEFGGPADVLFKRNFNKRTERKNSQVFTYRNTDKDGISNRMTISLGDATPDQLVALKATAKPLLEVTDLVLSPNFTTGTLNLSFTLPSKTKAGITLYNSSYQQVFAEKTTGKTYTGQLTLPKSGIYYLAITQGDAVFVRRMVKE